MYLLDANLATDLYSKRQTIKVMFLKIFIEYFSTHFNFHFTGNYNTLTLFKNNINCQNIYNRMIITSIRRRTYNVQCSNRWTHPSQSKARARMNGGNSRALSTASEAAGGTGTATLYRDVSKDFDWMVNLTEAAETLATF